MRSRVLGFSHLDDPLNFVQEAAIGRESCIWGSDSPEPRCRHTLCSHEGGSGSHPLRAWSVTGL